MRDWIITAVPEPNQVPEWRLEELRLVRESARNSSTLELRQKLANALESIRTEPEFAPSDDDVAILVDELARRSDA